MQQETSSRLGAAGGYWSVPLSFPLSPGPDDESGNYNHHDHQNCRPVSRIPLKYKTVNEIQMIGRIRVHLLLSLFCDG
jgi:hypothetical protein